MSVSAAFALISIAAMKKRRRKIVDSKHEPRMAAAKSSNRKTPHLS